MDYHRGLIVFFLTESIGACTKSHAHAHTQKPKEETCKGLCEEEVSLMWWNQWTLFIAKMH